MDNWIWLGLPALAVSGLSIWLLHRRGTAFLGKIGLCLAALLCVLGGLIWLYGLAPVAAQIMGGILAGLCLLGLCLVVAVAIPIAKMARSKGDAACPYVVVLGAKMEDGAPSPAMKRRIRRAYTYLQAHPETVAILSGGKGSEDAISEAECMFQGLVALGIEACRLWREEQAGSTWENLGFSLDLMEQNTGHRPAQIGLVSSDTHVYRASLLAKGWKVSTIPIPAKTEDPLQFINDYLREIAGVWHYYFLGGLYHD